MLLKINSNHLIIKNMLSLENYNNNAETFKVTANEALMIRNYDGDTCTLVVIINNQYIKFNCRLSGLNCAELKTKDPIEKEKALVAKNFLANYKNKILKCEFGTFDKYGRPLVILYSKDTNENINQKMIDLGFAKPYDGHGVKEF
jgi:endonuclease YncB( thermonuclease family)